MELLREFPAVPVLRRAGQPAGVEGGRRPQRNPDVRGLGLVFNHLGEEGFREVFDGGVVDDRHPLVDGRLREPAHHVFGHAFFAKHRFQPHRDGDPFRGDFADRRHGARPVAYHARNHGGTLQNSRPSAPL